MEIPMSKTIHVRMMRSLKGWPPVGEEVELWLDDGCALISAGLAVAVPDSGTGSENDWESR